MSSIYTIAIKSNNAKMTRIFILKKSTNKLKKWAVKEMIIPEKSEEKKEEVSTVNNDNAESTDKVVNADNQISEPAPKKKYNPYSKYRPKKSSEPKVKYGKLIYFGQAGYRDYIIMSEDKKLGKIDDNVDKVKEIYINRHSKSEHWDDPSTAGFWSRWISWNKPTLNECIADIREQFDIEVRLQE